MRIVRIESRGYLFTWDDPYRTNIYAINGDKHLFICDTFLGNKPMENVLEYLRGEDIHKPVIVLISHMDYDHYWGNGAFKDSLIISHENGWTRFYDEFIEAERKHENHKQGIVEAISPSMVFRDRVIFPEDGVEFYYTPGHSHDSASCMDVKDNVLFVGDNIEYPIPYLYSKDIDAYIDTLEKYLTRKPRRVISGHDAPMSNTHLIKENLEYLKKFKQDKVDRESLDERAQRIHKQNLKTGRAQ